MALAIIEYRGQSQGKHQFEFQLGSNKYFQVLIGDSDTYKRGGMKMMSKVKDQSPIMGPVAGTYHHKGSINIPVQHFDEDHQHVQLVSFKDQEGTSPVVSGVKRVLPAYSPIDMPERLTPETFSLNGHAMKEATNSPLKVEEVKYTEGMFLDTLLKVLPSVTDLIGSITKKKSGASGGSKLDIGALLGDSEKMGQLTDILKSLLQKSDSQSMSSGLGATADFSKAMNPALIAMIPQILDALADLGKIGAQINKDELDALKDLNPGVDDPDVQALLGSMSLSYLRPIPKIEFKPVRSVRLEHHGLQQLSSHGKNQFYFSYGSEIGIPLNIITPKPLPEGVVQFIVMRQDREVVIEHKSKFAGGEGMISQVPTIPAYKADDLVPGESYQLLVCVVWKGTSGQKFGVEMNLPLAIAKECVYDRMGDSVRSFEIKDADKYRAFWYRVWKGQFNDDVKRFEFQFTYYYKADAKSDANSKLPAEVMLKPDRPHKMVGKIRSGMTLSLETLNELMPARKEPNGYGQLTEKQLEAISNKDFTSVLQYAARTNFEIKGRENTVASLYVYPELELRNLILKKPGGISANGNITAFEEVSVLFPIPKAAHMKMTQSGMDADRTGEDINGFPVTESRNIELEPVNLIYKEHNHESGRARKTVW